MKKILLPILAIILCLPSLILVGCGNNDNYINIQTYFETKVNYQIYGRSGTNEAKLSDFTGDNTNKMDQYTSITFNGIPSWLYKMNVEYVVFDVYSNTTTDIEMYLKISNLKNGDQSNVGGSSVFTKQFEVKLEQNKPIRVKIPVNDYFESNSATTTIKLEITDSSYFKDQNGNTDLKYTIQNFNVIASH